LLLLLLLFVSFAYFTVSFHEKQMMSQVVASANRMSDVIKQSTHYSMLLNRKEDVYQIITTIGKEPGVEGIRIYNERGAIMFSTDKGEEHAEVNMQTEACTGCHEQRKPLESLPINNRVRIYESGSGHRILGVINPIRNEASCADAPCHAHPPERSVLGVLDVRVSLEQMDAGMNQANNTMLAYALGTILVLGAISVLFISKTVLIPVRRLMRGVREVSSGNLEHTIVVHSANELGDLAHAFNSMTSSLRHEKSENLRWEETLEQRVRDVTRELKEFHSRILHVEKMASLGKMAATVAHELNNPLEAILTYAKLIARRNRRASAPASVGERTAAGEGNGTAPETLEDAEIIAREAERCGSIVKSLLLFSRKQAGEFTKVPLRRVIDEAVRIVRHHCEIANVCVTVTVEGSEPTLLCDENQIRQALVALFVNAVEAMPGGGMIRVNVDALRSEEDITLDIADSGTGIAEEDLPHIFEPFFTTKTEGKGTGLGLSVVYGIVKRHEGRLSVSSEPGKGTRFSMVLPRVLTGAERAQQEEQVTETI
jgi:two-component system NtrC family sensor kinase